MIKEVFLGDIASFTQGQQVSISDQKTEIFDNSDVFLRIVNYTQNSNDFRYISKQDKKYHITKNNIIMVRYGAVGFVGRGLEGVLANNMFKISYDENIVNSNYLYRVLWSENIQNQILNGAQSTSMAAINFSSVSRVKIPLPPLPQQQKIANILDAADALRQKDKALLAKYDELTQALFLDMFGDPVSNPKGWEKDELKHFGKIITGNTPSRNDDDNYSSQHIEWLKTDNIKEDLGCVTIAKEYLSEKGLASARTVESGALLVACIAGSIKSIGRAALTDRRVSFNQQINAIQPNKEILPSYLFYLFKSTTGYIQEHASNGMKRMLTKGVFEKIQMIKPPLQLQNQFAARVQVIEQQKAIAQKSLEKSEALFNSLLQKAFKGELV